LNIINPIFKIQDENNNIFNIRKKEFENIKLLAKQIIEPVTEIGFEIKEVELKESRFSSGELSKTIKQTLVIKIQKGSSIIDLSLFIPKLVDDNYIIINKRRKIPLFQLFDIPIVTRGETIKLRTNVATLMVSKQKTSLPPRIFVSFIGKKIPLSLLMMAYYGPNEICQRYKLETYEFPKEEHVIEFSLMKSLIHDLAIYNDESPGYTQDDFIIELGRKYSKYNAKSKGHDILYALDLIPKVDIFTSKFLFTDSIIEELLLAIETEFYDDTLFTNKRVRCLEYLLFSKLSKIIFDLCFSNRTSKQPKFNINSTQLLSECNVSDIVQFDFSINPIEELTKLSRISLLGPGGFKRENIPKHLRDICPTMFGRICPVDTPDRDNCGVLQNIIPNVLLDENLKFSDACLSKQPISIPVSMIPFLEHDDQTRLQMASSQMRQAILLKKFDEPMIKSGCEHLYTDKTQFIKKAKKDGEVIYIDNKYMIVIYHDKEVEIFNISYRKIYVENMDFMNIYVKLGDKFKAGEILAESNFCKKGHINLGKNLLTGVMVHYGNNYEDGIVISDRLVNDDSLTSIHFKDLSFNLPPHKVLLSLEDNIYKPLPNEFEIVNVGQPYAIAQTLSSEDFYSVFNEQTKLEAEKTFIISEVKLFANSWSNELPEFSEWVEKRLKAQKESENNLKQILEQNIPKEAKTFIRENNLELFSFVGKYKNKKEKINGIQIKMIGIHFRKIKVGDKIANRHGNKGIISRIVPQNKMPQLEDGRYLDICINPLGSISRMNIGQLYELHLSMSLNDLKQHLIKMIDDNIDQNIIKQYLLDYIKIIDRTKDNWYLTQFTEQLPQLITKDFIDNLTLIQAPFESCKIEDVKNALTYTGTKFKQKLYDPLSKIHLENEIAVGFIYFFRMVHIAEEKLAARGIGTYAKRTLQPLGGRKNKGGQRCGEMETACLIGHDAPVNLFEFLTTKSDCIDLKNQYIRGCINPDFDNRKNLNIKPESVKLLDSYLTVIGVAQK
jgi:DNA-directed RNA polymerase beta subunit